MTSNSSRSVHELLEQGKWSVVQIDGTGEFDVLPNSWFTSVNKARYYDSNEISLATATKMVKNLDEAPEDWKIINVTLKKRNYGTFDAAMKKIVDLTHDRGTASESEPKGVGQRKIKPLVRLSPSFFKKTARSLQFSSDSDGDNETLSQRLSKKKRHHSKDSEVKTKSSPKKSRSSTEEPLVLPGTSSSSSLVVFESVLSPKKKRTENTKNDHPESSPSKKKIPEKKKNDQPESSPSKKKSPKKKKDDPSEDRSKTKMPQSEIETCLLKRKRLKHKCAFEYGPISLVTLAHCFCVLSRLIEGILAELNLMKELVQGQGNDEDENVDSEDEKAAKIKEMLPFYEYAKMKEFNAELSSDPELETFLTSYLKSKASKTNASICATSVARQLISKSLCKHLVLKGKSKTKHSFEKLKLKTIITNIVRKKFPKVSKSEINQTVDKALSRLFTQTASNIKQGLSKSDTPTKVETQIPEDIPEDIPEEIGSSASD
nr:PREDICTED: uncharacterized protein LOC109040458 isoform X2 [Bemisia tabaci]